MREILFKGKRVDNGEWIEGFYGESEEFYDNGGTECNYREGIVNIPHIVTAKDSFMVIPETVGQYIGLEDDKEKKIFDRDIVRIRNVNETSTSYVSVVEIGIYGVLVSAHPAHAKMGLSEKRSLADFVGGNYCECEIVGNIHDNPELIRNDK